MTTQGRAMFLVIALIILIGFGAPTAGTAPSESWTHSANMTWSYGKRTISFELLGDQFRDNPGWSDPAHDAPPLSIGQAVNISKQELACYVPEISSWTLESIALKCFDQPDRWYYLVTWQAEGEGVDHQLHIPVLMNGVPGPLEWYEPSEKHNR